MKKYFLLLIIGIIPVCLLGQQTAHKYVREMNYLVYLPDGYNDDEAKQWPLLLFLHGAGETGNDIELLKKQGIPKMIEAGKKFPFIVLSPQTPQYGWDMKDLKGLLDKEMAGYRIDPDRIYLTGLSMGGAGTWKMAVTYPEMFAAIVPICGPSSSVVEENLFQLSHTPVWCFHGNKDNIVGLSNSVNIMNALKEYNPEARLTIYPGVDHDSWTATYNNDSVFNWLLSHKKYVNKQVEVSDKVLQQYCSHKYASPDGSQTFSFAVENGALRVSINGHKVFLIFPESDRTFFADPNSRQHITFERDAKGEVTGFTLYQFENKGFARKL